MAYMNYSIMMDKNMTYYNKIPMTQAQVIQVKEMALMLENYFIANFDHGTSVFEQILNAWNF